MLVIDTPAEMRGWSRGERSAARRIALVPTMGALHDGHVALVARAHEFADSVVVSIFVNPMQFNRPDDFDSYPRPLDDDLAHCARLGVDAVYAPTAATMYPEGFETAVEPGALGDVLEGAQRPGHFRGVTTVVTKLFNAVEPDIAVFGQKDFQQLAIIRRMVRDLDMGIDIDALSTVREPDGLALSSRNRRLDADQRRAAVCVSAALRAVHDRYEAGERRTDTLVAAGRAVVDTERLARLEHLEIVDAVTLEHLDVIDRPAVAVTAVWFGDVRLIDNVLL